MFTLANNISFEFFTELENGTDGDSPVQLQKHFGLGTK